jgi:hypothetical protein
LIPRAGIHIGARKIAVQIIIITTPKTTQPVDSCSRVLYVLLLVIDKDVRTIPLKSRSCL